MSEIDEIISTVSSGTAEIDSSQIHLLDEFEIKPSANISGAYDSKNDEVANVAQSEISENRTEPQAEQASPTNDTAIDSKGIIELADVILSRLCVMGMSFMDYKASVSDFKLTSDEKKKLEPVSARLLQKYSVGLPDEWLLGLLVLAIYGGKVVSSMDESNKIIKVKKSASNPSANSLSRGRGRPRKEGGNV